MNKSIGVWMTPEGPIDINPDMPKEQMWFVLESLMDEYSAQRQSHREYVDRMRELCAS